MSALVPTYVRRRSGLHAARAGAALSYCGALALVAFLYWPNPVVSAAVLAAVLSAATAAHVGRQLLRPAVAALWFAALVTAINVAVSNRGTTVIFRGGTLLGHRFDVTLEALAWGAMTGLSLICVWLAFALYSATVDPDEMMRLASRFSHRSALTASLTTRLVPILARDARRHAEAARCRPSPPGRAALARATLSGVLERAVDVAAALEVRGYALARRRPRSRRPWSRHDVRVAGAAAALVAAAVAGKVAGVGALTADPTLHIAFGPGEIALVAAVMAIAIAPFAGARAQLGVAHG